MLELFLQREKSNSVCTPGELIVRGKRLCFTLEDVIREVPGQKVKEWKVYGETAIPAGRYKLALYDSPRHGEVVPLLLNVEGFNFVEIHVLNFASETLGCIGVGMGRPEDNSCLHYSRIAFTALMNLIRPVFTRGEEVWIGIQNPPA